MKLNIKPLLKKGLKAVNQKSPQILVALGLAGWVTTCVLVAKETPKVQTMIDKAKDEDGNISKADAMLIGAKGYFPSIVTGAVSTTCIVASTIISHKRYAGLLTAYLASKTSLEEYKKAVDEALEPADREKVKKQVADNQIADNPITRNEISKRGGDLCYDPWSGRYLPCTRQELGAIENELNRIMLHDGVVYMDTIYEYLGEDSTVPSRDYGWSMEMDGVIKILPTATIADNGRPCFVLNFGKDPSYDP